MRTRLARTATRTAATVCVAAACVLGTACAADAAPAGGPAVDPAPSACRPANQRGVVTSGPASAGHRHYRVVLTAAPGTSPCTLQGSPTGAVFNLDGSPRAVDATPYGDQGTPVAFGPGRPVAFDVRVPNRPGGASADEVTFTLRAPGGLIPGDAAAEGPMEVDAGTAIGPVTPA